MTYFLKIFGKTFFFVVITLAAFYLGVSFVQLEFIKISGELLRFFIVIDLLISFVFAFTFMAFGERL